MTSNYPAPCCCCCECCDNMPRYLAVTLDGFENKECQDCADLNRTYYLDYYSGVYDPHSNECPIWMTDLDDLPNCTHEGGGIYASLGSGEEGCVLYVEVSNYCYFRKVFSRPGDCSDFGAVPVVLDMDCCGDPHPDFSCKYCNTSIVVQGLDELPS